MPNRLASIFAPSMGPRIATTPPYINGPSGPNNGGYGAGASDPYYAQQAANPQSAANTALGQFGLALPTNPNPYLMFNNNPGGFADNHPKFAGAIDNAMGALANMGPTSLSAGDNISNVARGVMGNRAMHQQYLQQQYQQPFMIAQQIGQLQNIGDVHAASQANTAHINAQTAGLPQQQTDAHVLSGAHASYFQNLGSARQKASDAAAYKADPAGYMVEKENDFRQLNGGAPMTPEEEMGFRTKYTKVMSVAGAAGKVAVKATNSPNSPSKIDPRLKQAHDDAAKAIENIQKQLVELGKMKTGAYMRNNGDQKKAELQSQLTKATEQFNAIKGRIQGDASDAGGAARQASGYSPNNPFAK